MRNSPPAINPTLTPAGPLAQSSQEGGGKGFDRRRAIRITLAVFVPPLLVLLFVAVGAIRGWFYVGELTMDLAAISGKPFYFGAVANLGCMLWAGTAAICALAGAASHGENRPARSMFWGFGVLSLMLMADDWLLLHEYVVPTYLGLPEMILFAVYALALLALIVLHWHRIARADWSLFGAALGLFAFSMAIDVLPVSRLPVRWSLLLEDGGKLLGVSAWFGFFFSAALRVFTEARAAVPN